MYTKVSLFLVSGIFLFIFYAGNAYFLINTYLLGIRKINKNFCHKELIEAQDFPQNLKKPSGKVENFENKFSKNQNVSTESDQAIDNIAQNYCNSNTGQKSY